VGSGSFTGVRFTGQYSYSDIRAQAAEPLVCSTQPSKLRLRRIVLRPHKNKIFCGEFSSLPLCKFCCAPWAASLIRSDS